MSNDAFQEFLTANSRRNYPFAENASLVDDSESYELPNYILQNFRGFSRQQPEDLAIPIQLAAIVGSDAPALAGPFDRDPSGWVFVFRLGTLNQDTGTAQYLRILVNSSNLRERSVAFVPSAFGQVQPAGDMANLGRTRHPSAVNYDAGEYDYLAAMIQADFAKELATSDLPDVTERLLFSSALIEPALFTNIHKTEIERLVVEDECWAEADVKGNVVFREGYNMALTRLSNSIQIAPTRRAGQGVQGVLEYESWLCEGAPATDAVTNQERLLELAEECTGNILRVNGIGPADDLNFQIVGGNGVTVQNFPNESLIVLGVAIPTPVDICGIPEPPVEQSFAAALDDFDNDIFTTYYGGTPVLNQNAWSAAYDLTGVSFENGTNDEQRCTLIGRDCFMSATAWDPPVGAVIKFTDKDGNQYSRTITAKSDLGGDATVGTLDSPLPTSITSYAIALPIAGDYLIATRSRPQDPFGTTTASQRTMIEIVSAVGAIISTDSTDLPAEFLTAYEAAGTGDSGDPLFVLSESGFLGAVTAYDTTSDGPAWGETTRLAAIDAWLLSQGTQRQAFKAP